MKKTWLKFTVIVLAAIVLAPASLLAQKEEKEEKEKVKEKKDVQQIIITRKNDKDEKVVVEINGDKILINGKPLEEYKDKNGDISVRLSKLKDLEYLARVPSVSGTWNFDGADNFKMFNEDANHAMLGVTTEKTDMGAEINSITKESAAEKMGLKEGDVITRVDDKKIEGPDELSAAIKSHKPGDKVTVTYLRDKKEQKGTADLTKWKTQNFRMEMDDMNKNIDKVFPRVQAVPRMNTPYGQNFSWSGGGPKLGLSVQDTDDGKGVKVIEVDKESNAARAGIKEDDVVTEVDGKAVNSTDDMVKMIKENKDKTSMMFKLKRAGKTQNIEVKVPKKIKTTDL
ncbi:MAG: PDZ domain-containing protein [Ferruginibacter sp.]|nr:PDZ domain-containing protein [Chitinophagaceae bacterium]